jgi:hypothetical protein
MMGSLSYAISGTEALRMLGPIDDSDPEGAVRAADELSSAACARRCLT